MLHGVSKSKTTNKTMVILVEWLLLWPKDALAQIVTTIQRKGLFYMHKFTVCVLYVHIMKSVSVVFSFDFFV